MGTVDNISHFGGAYKISPDSVLFLLDTLERLPNGNQNINALGELLERKYFLGFIIQEYSDKGINAQHIRKGNYLLHFAHTAHMLISFSFVGALI